MNFIVINELNKREDFFFFLNKEYVCWGKVSERGMGSINFGGEVVI